MNIHRDQSDKKRAMAKKLLQDGVSVDAIQSELKAHFGHKMNTGQIYALKKSLLATNCGRKCGGVGGCSTPCGVSK